MGRRKIEIKPITHERNRSVTFLKRKNGLFKKAYELGVLCSVQVAVIIFEERPGHHVKLYQYCSNDINDMVQKHLRHEGEKDTKGPGDFSGNHGNNFGPLDDEDDEEGDEEVQMRGTKRRIRTGPSDLAIDVGMDMRHVSSRPVGSTIGPVQSRASATSPSLPDRFHEPHHLAHGNPISIPTDRPSGGAPFNFRSPGDPSFPFYPPSTSPSFIPGNFNRTPSVGGFRPRPGGHSASNYEHYPQMMSGAPQQSGNTSGLFGFIGDQPPAHPQSGGGGGSGVWPVHGENTGEPRPGVHSSPPTGGSGGTEWLDFISPGGNDGKPTSNPPGRSAAHNSVPGRSPESWERSAHNPDRTSSRRGADERDGRASRNGRGGRTEIKTESKDG